MVKSIVDHLRRAGLWRLICMFVLLPLVGAGLNAVVNPRVPWRVVVELEEGEIDLGGVAELEGAVLWLDARTAQDYASGHIPGAVRLSLDEFDHQLMAVLDVWTPGQPVVVYCGSPACGLSSSVADLLRTEYGFDNVHVLKGGWAEWLQSEREVEP